MNGIFAINKASKDVGLGHTLRGITLLNYISSRCKFRISALTYGENIKKCLDFYSEDIRFNWHIQDDVNLDWITKLINLEKPKLIIIDCENDSSRLISFFHTLNLKTLALDFYNFSNIQSNITINLFKSNSDALPKNITTSNYKIFEGERYSIIKDDFIYCREQRKIRSTNKFIKSILISFGGSDPSNNTFLALDLIMNLFSNVTINIILGPLFGTQKIDKLSAYQTRKNKVNFHDSPKSLAPFLGDSDLIFCGGGTTLLESFCVGVPAIVIPQNKGESEYAAHLAKKGLCCLYSEIDWRTIFLLETRNRITLLARNFLDGRGKERIGSIINQELKELIN